MLEWLAQRLSDPIAIWIACMFCGIGVPVPEEVLGAWSGIQAERIGGLPQAWALAVSGFLIRDLICWTAGRTLGERAIRGLVVRGWLSSERVTLARQTLRERGGKAILLGRLMVGMRPLLWFIAGSSGVRLAVFLPFDLLGLCLTTAALVLAGHTAGVWVLTALEGVVQGPVVGLLLLLALGLAGWLASRHKRTRG